MGLLAVAIMCAGLIAAPARSIRPAAADTVHTVADFANDPFPGRPSQYGSAEATGTRHVLVVLVRFADPPTGAVYTRYTPEQLAQTMFGPTGRNVAGYFTAASGGRFTIEPVEEHDGAPDGVVTLTGQSYTAWHDDLQSSEERIRFATAAALPSLDLASVDLDHDGTVDPSEFTVLVVVGDGSTAAVTTGAGLGAVELEGAPLPDRRAVIAGGWAITPMTYAHELFHTFFFHMDLYGFGIGTWDVMGPTMGIDANSWFLPSAATRLHLGWAHPTVVRRDGWYDLALLDRGGEPVLLHDPARGVREYFLVEYRGRGSLAAGYDSFVPDDGVVIERVQLGSSWTDVREGNPPVEIIAPDGIRRSPACASRATVRTAAAAGVTTLAIAEPADLGVPPFTAFVDDPAVPEDEELVDVRAVSVADRTVTLAAPTALAHGVGTQINWRLTPFTSSAAPFAVTSAAAPAVAGATEIHVGRVTGRLPASFPFDVVVGESRAVVTVTAISGSTWTVRGAGGDDSVGIAADVPAGARIVAESGRGGCRGGSDVDAWSPVDDPRTPADTAVLDWRDGTPAGMAVRWIRRDGDRYRIYADVPGAGVRLDAPRGRSFPTGDTTLTVDLTNTDSRTDAYLVTTTDPAGRVWARTTKRVRAGATASVGLRITNDPMGRGPSGGRFITRAVLLSDPSVSDVAETAATWWTPGCDDPRAEPCGDLTLRRVRDLDPSVLAAGSGHIADSASRWRGEAELRNATTIHLEVPEPSVSVGMPVIDDDGNPIDPTTMPRCGVVPGVTRSGPAGTERLRIATRIDLDVRWEDAALGRAYLDLSEIEASPTRTLHYAFTCDATRATSQTLEFVGSGRYRVEANAEVALRWESVQGSFLADVLDATAGAGVPCRGGSIPRCDLVRVGQANDPLLGGIAAVIPAPNGPCIDDACPGWFPVAWPTEGNLDLAVSLPPGARLTLRDATGTVVATAAPEIPALGRVARATGAPQVQSGSDAATSFTYIAPVPVESRYVEAVPGESAHERYTIVDVPTSQTILFIPSVSAGPVLDPLRLSVPNLAAGDYVLGIEIPPDADPAPEGGYPVEWRADDADLDGVPDVVDDVVFAADDIRARVYDANGGWQLVADGGLVDGRVVVSRDAKGRPRLTAVGHVAGPDQRLIAIRAVVRLGPTGWTGRASVSEAKGRAWLGSTGPRVSVVDGRTVRIEFPEAVASRGGEPGPLRLEFRDVVP